MRNGKHYIYVIPKYSLKWDKITQREVVFSRLLKRHLNVIFVIKCKPFWSVYAEVDIYVV
jgi:hypothetical protein